MGFWHAVKDAARKYGSNEADPAHLPGARDSLPEETLVLNQISPSEERTRLEKRLFDLWDYSFTVQVLEQVDKVLAEQWQELESKGLLDKAEVLESALLEPVMNRLLSGLSPIAPGPVQDTLNRLSMQRWLYFTQPETILLDQTTGCLWPNLNRIEALETMNKDLPEVLQRIKYVDLDNWELPTKIHLKYISQNPRYPFFDADLRLSGQELFGIFSDRVPVEVYCLRDDSLVSNAAPESRSCLLPCNRTFATQPFASGVSADKYYKALELIRFLIKQRWEPDFQNPYLAKGYAKLRDGMKALTEYIQIRLKLKLWEQGKVTLFAPLDPAALLAKYPAARADQSPLCFWEQSGRLLAELEQSVADLLEEQEEVLQKADLLSHRILQAPLSEVWDAEDRQLMLDRQKLLLEALPKGLNQLQNILASWEREVGQAQHTWREVAEKEPFFQALAEQAEEKRPPFALVIDFAVRLVNDSLDQIQTYLAKRDLLALLVSTHVTRSKAYEQLLFQKLPTLAHEPEQQESWHKERRLLEQAVTALFQSALADQLNQEMLAKSLRSFHDLSLRIDTDYTSEVLQTAALESRNKRRTMARRTVETLYLDLPTKEAKLYWSQWLSRWER